MGWRSVPPGPPGSLFVNGGDFLSLWSGGRWRAARHRVVIPAPVNRHSAAFFYDPPFTASAAPLVRDGPGGAGREGGSYGTYGDYILERYRATHASFGAATGDEGESVGATV